MPKIRKLLQFLQIQCAFYGGNVVNDGSVSSGLRLKDERFYGGGGNANRLFYVVDAVVAVAKNPICNIYNNW